PARVGSSRPKANRGTRRSAVASGFWGAEESEFEVIELWAREWESGRSFARWPQPASPVRRLRASPGFRDAWRGTSESGPAPRAFGRRGQALAPGRGGWHTPSYLAAWPLRGMPVLPQSSPR